MLRKTGRVQTRFFDIKGYFEIQVFEVTSQLYNTAGA